MWKVPLTHEIPLRLVLEVEFDLKIGVEHFFVSLVLKMEKNSHGVYSFWPQNFEQVASLGCFGGRVGKDGILR